MKKFYSILILIALASSANATIWAVTVQASAFSPSTLPNVVCGDSVVWTWGGSFSHTTTSTTIPATAATWDAPINSTSPGFMYVPTVAGVYNYQCTPHLFTGTFTVTCPVGVASINNNYFSAAYPNPFSSKLIIETPNADMISFYNMVGEKIKTISLPHGQTKTEINTADLREGIYFYAVIKEGAVIETRKIVKN